MPVGRTNADRLERRTLVPKEKRLSFLVATNIVASRAKIWISSDFHFGLQILKWHFLYFIITFQSFKRIFTLIFISVGCYAFSSESKMLPMAGLRLTRRAFKLISFRNHTVLLKSLILLSSASSSTWTSILSWRLKRL